MVRWRDVAHAWARLDKAESVRHTCECWHARQGESYAPTVGVWGQASCLTYPSPSSTHRQFTGSSRAFYAPARSLPQLLLHALSECCACCCPEYSPVALKSTWAGRPAGPACGAASCLAAQLIMAVVTVVGRLATAPANHYLHYLHDLS